MSELDSDGSTWINFKNKADCGGKKVIYKSLGHGDAIYVNLKNNRVFMATVMYQKFLNMNIKDSHQTQKKS